MTKKIKVLKEKAMGCYYDWQLETIHPFIKGTYTPWESAPSFTAH